MTLSHDPEADALYITLSLGPYSWGHELDSDRRVDFGPDNQPIGIELLNVSLGVDLSDLPHRSALDELLAANGFTILVPTHP